MRNLDLSALRALQAVAELGGVTKAAHQLNLTQSAISMQLKRLEESLGKELLKREGRSVSLTPEGQELIRHARKLLAINDAIFAQFSQKSKTQSLKIGITSDVVYFAVAGAVKSYSEKSPQTLLDVSTGRTTELRKRFEKGELDLIVTTEFSKPNDCIHIIPLSLAWFGAVNGEAWRRHPLPVGINAKCAYRQIAENALNDAGIEWRDCQIGGDEYGNDMLCAADIGINVFPEKFVVAGSEAINHAGALPPLPDTMVNAYVTYGEARLTALEMVEEIRIAMMGKLQS